MLTATRWTGLRQNGCQLWECRCDCGNICTINTNSLRTENTRSCGCLRRACVVAKNTTHGLTKTPTHMIWVAMRDRCRNPNNKNYRSYGGRGIYVCERWNSYMNFLTDMGEKPAEKSIDRIDNDGPYTPGNCRWASIAEQAINRRGVYRIILNGSSYSVRSFSLAFGLSECKVRHLTQCGVDGETILRKLKPAVHIPETQKPDLAQTVP
jgi:hypothetical protein